MRDISHGLTRSAEARAMIHAPVSTRVRVCLVAIEIGLCDAEVSLSHAAESWEALVLKHRMVVDLSYIDERACAL